MRAPTNSTQNNRSMKLEIRKNGYKYAEALLGAVGILLIALFWWMQLDQAGTAAEIFLCPPNDGCFQMFNPLRRLAAGQILGRDFMFFYGPGSILAHYPAFRLFGSDLLASEMARVLVTPPLFMLATFAFIRTLLRRNGLSLFLTGLGCWLGYQWFMSVVVGHNSLFGVRAALPILAASVVLLAYRRETHLELVGARPSAAVLLLGILSAIGLFISPDQGAAMTASLLVVLLLISGGIGARIKNIIYFLITAVAGTVLLYGLLPGSSALDLIKFHFSGLPADQMWYFGVPPQPFFYSLEGIMRYPSLLLMTELTLLIFLVAVSLKNRIGRDKAAAISYLSIYGLLGCIGILGYVKTGYFDAMRWSLSLIALVLLAAAYGPVRACLSEEKNRSIRHMVLAGTVTATILVTVYAVYSGVTTVRISRNFNDVMAGMEIRNEKASVMGVNLDKGWTRHRETVLEYVAEADGDGLPLWSTYSSIVEAELGIFNPDTDYIIHTLSGDNRKEYFDTFIKSDPSVVVATDPYLLFNEWLWHAHWDFFESLATRYDFQEKTRMGAVWTLNDEASEPEKNEWQIAEQVGESYVIRAEGLGGRSVWTVRARYNTNNPWSALPVLGRTPRLFIWTEGGNDPIPVSLPPDEYEYVFPVFTDTDTAAITLRPVVKSMMPWVTMELESVKFRKSEIPKDNLNYFFRDFKPECQENNGMIQCDNNLPKP
jgi:hypothetical protein